MIIFHSAHFKSFPNAKKMFMIFITNCTITQFIVKFFFDKKIFLKFSKATPIFIVKNPFFKENLLHFQYILGLDYKSSFFSDVIMIFYFHITFFICFLQIQHPVEG